MTTVKTEATDVISPCPRCGSGKGAHIRIIKRSKKKSVPNDRMVKIPRSWDEMSNPDVDIPGRKTLVHRRHNPHKVLSVLGLPRGKNPIINPPRLGAVKDPERMKKLAQNYANWWKVYDIPFELAQLYFQKHPDAWDEMKEYIYEYVLPVRRILGKVMESAFDDRWDRSLRDWADILITAIEKSPRKAREEHYGLTSDGKRIKLSINRIKQMKSWLWDLVKDLPKQVPFYITFMDFMFNVAKADPELYEELKRLEQKYDHIRDDLIKSRENNINQNQSQSKNQENQHHYTYFEFRHHDKELYEKQKEAWKQRKRKSHPDGWKTCCTIKPSGLAKIRLNDKNFSLYKRMINNMNTNVYKCLDMEKQWKIWHDAYNMLIDMGWPKRLVLEKMFADLLESNLRRRYEQKGLKPDPSEFDTELDGVLHNVFRSDEFSQANLEQN